MRIKESFGTREIEKDIVCAKMMPGRQSKYSFFNSLALGAVLAVVLVVVEAFFIKSVFWLVLSFFVIAPLAPLIVWLKYKLLSKKVSFKDYEIHKETVKSTNEDNYTIYSSGLVFPRKREISSYTITFENEKTWHVSEDNYSWSKEYPMKALGVYHTAKPGDVMYVVTKRSDGKVVMAYHTDYFQLSDSSIG